jgi:hypothetical protein
MKRRVINVNGHLESWPEGTLTPRNTEIGAQSIEITVNNAYATGGYILPDFLFKEMARITDFNTYWEMERHDLAWLIKRLESYEY